jgi:hypothetical protein
MKRLLILLLGLLLLQTAPVFAATGSISKSTFTASVSFIGIDAVTYINVALKTISTGAGASAFTFTPTASGLSGNTTWFTANEYAIIYTTWTGDAGGRVLVYTDNTAAADANPKYTGTGDPVGLVCSTGTTSPKTSPAAPLQLCWRVTDISTNTLNINYHQWASSMSLFALGLAQDYHCFIWMKDKGNTSSPWYGTDNAYATIKSFDSAGQWIQHGENDWGDTPSPDCFYLGADFENAKAGNTYGTNTLRFDLYTD